MSRSSIPARRVAPRKFRVNERKPREERWAELIDAATQVFAEKGYDATSLQDIAKRVGILKGSIYYYIASKADLRSHVLRDAHQMGLQTMAQMARGKEDPLTRLYNMIVGHIFYVCRNLAKTAVFLHEVKKLTAQQRADILGDEHAYRRLFQSVIVDAQSQGLVRAEVDAKLAAVCALSSLNSIYTWYQAGGDFTPTEIAAQFAAMTLMSLATPKGVRILTRMPPLTPAPRAAKRKSSGRQEARTYA